MQASSDFDYCDDAENEELGRIYDMLTKEDMEIVETFELVGIDRIR